MPKFERVKDPWKELRKDLYGNVEPTVKLEAITMPLDFDSEDYLPRAIPEESIDHYDVAPIVDFSKIEELPAIAASTSYNSKIDSYEKAVKLNKQLISKGHMTPFECVHYLIRIKGLSKAAGAQLSRYRHSGHISKSRRFVSQEPSFVYPMLGRVENKDQALIRYRSFERINKVSYEEYQYLRETQINVPVVGTGYPNIDLPPLTKEEARGVIPVFSATGRTMWVNVRSLRHIFDERLRSDTESELRRLIWMIWDLVEPLTPSFYFDIKEEIENIIS